MQLYELWRCRDLIQLLYWRDFGIYYKEAILGPQRYIITLVLSTVVFTVIFGNNAMALSDSLPLFCIS